MLKARITNIGEWKAIVSAIGDVVEDAMFIVNDDGITFRGMDPSHVALLDVTFPKSSFEILESQTSFFGIVVDDFKTILNVASVNDTIELNLVNENLMKISITGSLEMEYKIRLLEKTEVNTPLPKTKYKSKFLVEPNTLSRIISSIQNISKYVTINCNKDNVEFSGKGDVGDAKINLKKGSPELERLDSIEQSTADYNLEYIASIIRSIGKTSKSVNLEYANNNPIHIVFELPSMIKIEYYLAPRVEV